MSAQTQAATLPTPLDLSMVQPADIILTAADSTGSKVIRNGTCGTFSHAILALKNGYCIQAMPGAGVTAPKLSFALKKANHAVLYRHQSINEEYASWVCHFAKFQKDKGYDYVGAIRSGVSSGCGIARLTPVGIIIELAHDKTQKRQHNNTFFLQ